MGLAELLIAAGIAIMLGAWLVSRMMQRSSAATARSAANPTLDRLARAVAEDRESPEPDGSDSAPSTPDEVAPLPVPASGRFAIAYRDSRGNETRRTIDLKGLRDEGDDITIQAYCYLREDIRHFKVSQIEQLTVAQTRDVIEDPDEAYEFFEELLERGNAQLADAGSAQAAKRAAPTELSDVVFLDLETTGLDSERDRIIELAAVRVFEGKQASLSVLIDSGRKIPRQVTELTGITDQMAAEQGEPIETALPALLDFIGKLPVIAYNAPFDVRFILAEAARQGLGAELSYYCLLAEARQRLPQLKRHRLADLAAHYRIETPQAHRALSDVALTMEVYERLMGESGAAPVENAS
ncbi:MAG: exonuclease domain-containing protein [Pseudomonadota bacterium]